MKSSLLEHEAIVGSNTLKQHKSSLLLSVVSKDRAPNVVEAT
jgi:hypothetical protein